jgi:hypothetical protein
MSGNNLLLIYLLGIEAIAFLVYFHEDEAILPGGVFFRKGHKIAGVFEGDQGLGALSAKPGIEELSDDAIGPEGSGGIGIIAQGDFLSIDAHFDFCQCTGVSVGPDHIDGTQGMRGVSGCLSKGATAAKGSA